MAESETNEIPPEVLKALHAPDKVTLYSLEPWEQPTNKDKKLYQYKVLGQVEPHSSRNIRTNHDEFRRYLHGLVRGDLGRIMVLTNWLLNTCCSNSKHLISSRQLKKLI